MEKILPGRELDRVIQAGSYWLRSYNSISWASVEPVEGKRNWNVLAVVNGELRTTSEKGMQAILSIRVSPFWAQQEPGHSCSPIKPEKLRSFAGFMHDLVARYSKAPYNVKYWEIWNEPDIDPSLVSPESPFGCWGDQNDAYYGGGYYADMLKLVYPKIKAADPNAQVLIGGLVLDCDPRPGAGCAIVGRDPKPSMFLEGILRNDGGSFFDGLSFHAYDYYQGRGKYYGNPNWQSAWNTTGPVEIAKALYIKSLLSKYGTTGKFIMASEVAILCTWCSSHNADLETTKAYYVVEAYSAAIALGLRSNIWFSLQGWDSSGLINEYLTILPAFTAFQFSSSKLANSTWERDIDEYPGVKIIEFVRGERRIWVLWSSDGNSHLITLPSVPLAAWDDLGNHVIPEASMNISISPIYLDWNP